MKHFVVYSGNGRIIRFGLCQDETFDMQAGEGEFILEAESVGNQYIQNGELVDMPPQPSLDYVFDYDTKQWTPDIFAATQKAYAKRNELLSNGPDRISPIWWSSMTPEQQQAWSAYRQHLLDVPEQPGFPLEIDWSAPPT